MKERDMRYYDFFGDPPSRASIMAWSPVVVINPHADSLKLIDEYLEAQLRITT